jgi:NADP-dependent 3-hydroxy acid dehydrogenase YdfG
MKKKIILITGAASGIGYQLAKKFLFNGHVVFMTDFNEKALKISFDKIKGELLESTNPGTPYWYVLDVCVTSFWTNTVNTHCEKVFKTKKEGLKEYEKVK